VVHGVRLERGWWVCNLHATAHSEARARADVALAAQTAVAWSAGAPVVLGGDLNTRVPSIPAFAHAAGHSVDHLFVRPANVAAPGRTLDRGPLSDHLPLLAEVA
jgi:endonuclease/exonuclease/phosphatase family metal-dependent hydrolase